MNDLKAYSEQSGISTVIMGISGGIDSALTAALFKKAGYFVTGVLLPIHQNESETARGREVCTRLGIQCLEKDLTHAYTDMIFYLRRDVDTLIKQDDRASAMRRGNIRARLRMMTLYNLASLHQGFVASTDNFSELAAGFWTLHGDVGDVAPIQSLTKSWEVPAMAEFLGVPHSVIEAVPTDGLGITDSDEASFGFSYLEFDIVLLSMMYDDVEKLTATAQDAQIVDTVRDKIHSTGFKRANPVNLTHPQFPDRFLRLDVIDKNIRQGYS
jgi:nicotinamide-nucleotide amidase